jgi:hypothetical protein
MSSRIHFFSSNTVLSFHDIEIVETIGVWEVRIDDANVDSLAFKFGLFGVYRDEMTRIDVVV